MPSRHGQPDPSDETTQQAYYGRQGANPPPRGPQQGQYQPTGGQYGAPQPQYGGQQQNRQQGYPPPGQGDAGPSAPQAPKKRKKWPWIVGAVVLLFLIIAIAGGGGNQPTSPTAGSGQPASSAAPAPAAPAEGGQSSAPAAPAAAAAEGITYEVTGKGKATNITYSSNGSGGISQQNNATLPFKKTIANGDDFFGFWSLTAQNGQGSGTISCKITKNGEVINENSSEGPYAVVTCQGS